MADTGMSSVGDIVHYYRDSRSGPEPAMVLALVDASVAHLYVFSLDGNHTAHDVPYSSEPLDGPRFYRMPPKESPSSCVSVSLDDRHTPFDSWNR